MTTPMLMTQHLTDETLAAYVDDRLDSATRQPVTEHLVTCGECREIVLMASAYQVDRESAKVSRRYLGLRDWVAGIGAVAVAAMIVIAAQPNPMVLRAFFDKLLKAPEYAWNQTARVLLRVPDVDDVVAASGNVRERPSDGRLAGGFAYSAKPSTMRGSEKELGDLGNKAKLLELRMKLEETKRDPHALGLVRLLTAENGKRDVSDAVDALEIAYHQASGKERDAVAIDLAAALITYARWSGHDKNNHARALELSNDVLKRRPQSPEALWNRAVAIASLNRDDEALRAFDDYLKVDSTSNWADEARERKATIESFR